MRKAECRESGVEGLQTGDWRRERARRARSTLAAVAVLVSSLASANARLSAQDPRLSSIDSAASPLDRAARAYASARTARAEFVQTLVNPGTNFNQVTRGEFFQRGPLRFAFRFTEPAGDAIVSDGDALWVYLPSAAKGQVLKLPGESAHSFDFLSELLGAPREHYTIRSLGDTVIASHPVATYALAPKQSSAPFTRATLWVGRADALLWQLEAIEPSGLVRRLQFSAIHTDVELPKGALTFTVPEGVKVIDSAGLLGRKP
ncbi:MAG: outer membrane lipoprotein carrier protein LolA [Gemmatimonadales bacterium]